MHTLTLVGIGTGNPDHLTLQAVKALNAADLILIPRKGADKSDLAALRRAICAAVITNPATRLVEFDLPLRDPKIPDYQARVEAWHGAIAAVWARTIAAHLGPTGRVALLVWGDPALYDSTLRIAARLTPAPKIEVIPGITAIQALTAAHGLTLNQIGAPFIVTTGRRLRDGGWPAGVDTCVVRIFVPEPAARGYPDLVGRLCRDARSDPAQRRSGRGRPPHPRRPHQRPRPPRLDHGHLPHAPHRPRRANYSRHSPERRLTSAPGLRNTPARRGLPRSIARL